MGNGIILCEGETDQVLIGEYLCAINKWEYNPKNVFQFGNAKINEYKRGDNHLGIWAVGGSNFQKPIEEIARRQYMRSNSDTDINRVAIVTDNDDENAGPKRLEIIMQSLKKGLQINTTEVMIRQDCNKWINIPYKNQFDLLTNLQICCLLVPLDSQGALETFTLNYLSENYAERRNVIKQSDAFIKGFKSNVYLQKRREKVKAKFGVSMAIFCPDRTFTTMNELIKNVDWSTSNLSRNQFKLLEDI